MASFTVVAGQTDNQTKTVDSNDIGIIRSGGRLDTSAAGNDAIIWRGGSTSPGVNINNSGTIAGGDRGIDTGTNITTGSITFINNVGAALTAPDDAFRIAANISNGTIVVSNSGTIASSEGQAIDFDDLRSSTVHVTIANQATGLIRAARADAIRPGENTLVNNFGRIVAETPAVPGTPPVEGDDGIDFQDHGGGAVLNSASGVIIGTKHGIGSPGQDATSTTSATPGQPVHVTNYGTIRGEAGSGINFDTAGDTTTVIFNVGMIEGRAVEGIQSGDGIDVDGQVVLTNFGTIQALGTRTGGLSEGVSVGGGTISNIADATIFSSQRAISVDGGADPNNPGMDLPAHAAVSIYNEGRIEGAVNGEAIRIVGSFADTINNTASGRIVGDILTGGGNDTVTNSGFILGTIHAGDGDDTVDGGGSSSRIFVLGDNGHDSLTGGSGDDELHGDTAFILAPHGNDTLIGGGGNDLLFGEEGNDDLTGGPGRDIFTYRLTSGVGDGADRILDFTPGEDQIEVRFLSGLQPDPSIINRDGDDVVDAGDAPAMVPFDNGLVLDFGGGNTLSVVGATSLAIGTDIILTA